MNKKQAGRMGGLATKANHGRDHFRQLGARGGRATWNKYKLRPWGTYQFALIERATGKVKNGNWPFGG